MDKLAGLLSHEHRLLDLLVLKLDQERRLLAAGEDRLLPDAATEVERALERVQVTELRRSILLHDLARDLDGSGEALTMRTLAEDSAEPYRTIFSDHRRAFLDLAAEIEAMTARPRVPSLVDFLR